MQSGKEVSFNFNAEPTKKNFDPDIDGKERLQWNLSISIDHPLPSISHTEEVTFPFKIFLTPEMDTANGRLKAFTTFVRRLNVKRHIRKAHDNTFLYAFCACTKDCELSYNGKRIRKDNAVYIEVVRAKDHPKQDDEGKPPKTGHGDGDDDTHHKSKKQRRGYPKGKSAKEDPKDKLKQTKLKFQGSASNAKDAQPDEKQTQPSDIASESKRR